MSIFETFLKSYEFNRSRTLGLLQKIEEQADPMAALGWRPGPGRAHICWQLMHIAVTEDIFASERLAPERRGRYVDIWPRFRGGSTPDDVIASPAEIRSALETSRAELRPVLLGFNESQLGWIPEALKQRGLTLLDVLHIIGWHEAHHQGQAHLTMNLFLARKT
jgi:hypothetical protein